MIKLVQRFINPCDLNVQIFRQGKAEEGGDAVASSTDDYYTRRVQRGHGGKDGYLNHQDL